MNDELHDHPHHRDDPDTDLHDARMDPAQQQLAKALRSSFRLLSVIMVLVVIFFLLTGLAGIDSAEVGIITRFGRIVGVAEEGLTYAWPFPIGGIEKLDISQQEIEINDFWMSEKPEDRTRRLSERKTPKGGLRPGYDGALLTGDHNLYHVRLKCGYRIRRTWDRTRERDPALQYKLNVQGPDGARELVRSAVCSATVLAAADRTVDALRTDRRSFEAAVIAEAQSDLDRCGSGLEMTFVSVERDTWPLRVLPDFTAAQNAQKQAESARADARSDANRILQRAAGNSYRKLIDPAKVLGITAAAGDRRADAEGPADLIGQYVEARRGPDAALQEKLLAQINDELTSPGTTGEARAVIDRARSESTGFVQATRKRVTEFWELLPKFRDNPDYLLADHWADTLEEILASPTVEVVLVGAGNRKINLYTKQNPEIAKRIVRELAKA